MSRHLSRRGPWLDKVRTWLLTAEPDPIEAMAAMTGVS